MIAPKRKRIRKYRQGAPINAPVDRLAAAMGSEYIWCRGRAWHPVAVAQWPLSMILCAPLFRAEITPEWAVAQTKNAP